MTKRATFAMTTDELVARLDELRREHFEEQAEYATLARALQSRKDQQSAFEACNKFSEGCA